MRDARGLVELSPIGTNRIATIAPAQSSDVLTLSNTGGWALELQGLDLAATLLVALQGAGRQSVAGTRGRWN
jgi:putative oxidoreductase